MEEEFTISTGSKVFYGVMGGGIVAAGIFFIKIATSEQPAGFIGIGLVALGILIIGQIRKRIILSADLITGTNVLQTRELPTQHIKGCRIGAKTIRIEPDSTTYRAIIINNYSDFSNSGDLVTWLKQNFKDQDKTDLQNERERFLLNSKLGATTAEREARISRAKIIAIIYSVAGLVIGFSCIKFDDKPGAVVVLIAIPLLGILLMAASSGLIKFLSSSKRSVISSIYIGLFAPSLMLFFGAALGHNVYQYNNVYAPIVTLSLAVAGLFYFFGINRDLGRIAGQIVVMLITATGYSYGIIVQINCVFDKSVPQVIPVSITSKYEEYNKGEHYHLRLSPFVTGADEKEIEVGKITYSRYNQGDTIDIDLKPGVLNIPWYALHRN